MYSRIIHNVVCCGVLLFNGVAIAEHDFDQQTENNQQQHYQNGSSLIERDGVIYSTIEGTSTPDYGSKERLIIRDGKVYNAIPGTTTPDYGTGRYIIQERYRE
ncbi:hypothetical protein CKO09_08920 [Chromatium weissei]|nr:hypothetical protein [Chromatium weissei]